MGSRGSALFLSIALSLTSDVLAQTPARTGLVVPTFTDLTIKKRHSFGVASGATTEVLNLKDARERREFIYEQPGNRRSSYVTITQCDRGLSVQLNPEAQLYSITELVDWSARLAGGRREPEGQGPEVTTTFDAVDTGERRPAGRYVARRVRTTVTVEPSPGAHTPPSIRETDGWYIDLPGLGCSDATMTGYCSTFRATTGLPSRCFEGRTT